MSKMGDIWRHLLGIALGSACAFSASCANAQIKPDRTLPNNSNVTINGSVFNITGGTQVGRNLFHSFQQFSVPTGGTASFNNGLDIQNIISRVTGGEASSIDGLIKASGTANLFFLNPNGIVFGQHASLSIGGSFLATTANAIQFGNQGTFSASVPDNPALLTVNPSALFYNQIAAGASIQNSSIAPAGVDPIGKETIGLRVPNGNSLLLVGGDLSLDGGRLNADGGRVELAGLAAPGSVGLNFAGNTISLNVPNNVQRADVSLTNASQIDVTDRGQGAVKVSAGNLNISGGSRISAGINSGLTAVTSQPSNITLDASGVVSINQESKIINQAADQARGNAGDINIKADEITITNLASHPDPQKALDAVLDTHTLGQGHPGNISLEANGSITLIGQDVNQGDHFISTHSEQIGFGGGNISLKANSGSIYLSKAYLDADSGENGGDAGNISVFGYKSVSLKSNSDLFSGAGTFGTTAGKITVQSAGSISFDDSLVASHGGNADDITILGRSVSITGGTEVSSRSFDGEKSGNIQINATDSVDISGSIPSLHPRTDRAQGLIFTALLTTSEVGTNGISGQININTSTLRISDGASLRAESLGGRSISGSINITANTVELTGGGQITTTAFSQSDAGNINLNVADRINISGANSGRANLFNQIVAGKISATDLNLDFVPDIAGADNRTKAEFVLGNESPASGIFTNTSIASTAKGGNLKITTGHLQVLNGGQINVSSQGQGNAGIVDLKARSISLDNQGSIFAETAFGRGGNITLDLTDFLLLRHDSRISATAGIQQAGGDGGNITINTPFIIAVPGENSDITANASVYRVCFKERSPLEYQA